MPTNYKFNKIIDDNERKVFEDQTKTLEVEISKIKTNTFLHKGANTNFNTDPFKKEAKNKLKKDKWELKVLEKAKAAFTAGKEILRDTFATKKEAMKAAKEFMNNKADKIIKKKTKENFQKNTTDDRNDVIGEGFGQINVDLPEAFK
jgi:acyl-CoA reductase-like NAD-dependent aldehyde dehydrogenase